MDPPINEKTIKGNQMTHVLSPSPSSTGIRLILRFARTTTVLVFSQGEAKESLKSARLAEKTAAAERSFADSSGAAVFGAVRWESMGC